MSDLSHTPYTDVVVTMPDGDEHRARMSYRVLLGDLLTHGGYLVAGKLGTPAKSVRVTGPEPRFYARDLSEPAGGQVGWSVFERVGEVTGRAAARFFGPDAKRHAQDHADRLNREASS